MMRRQSRRASANSSNPPNSLGHCPRPFALRSRRISQPRREARAGDDGTMHEYGVFFAVSKAGKGKGLNLLMQSAYISDGIPKPSRRKPIKLMVIANNTATNKPIRPP